MNAKPECTCATAVFEDPPCPAHGPDACPRCWGDGTFYNRVGDMILHTDEAACPDCRGSGKRSTSPLRTPPKDGESNL